MGEELLETVEHGPAGQATNCVIWLHGLGADGHDFEPVVPELGLPGELGVRFVFPHAPRRPVTINGGVVMRAWYDIRQPSVVADPDELGVRQSAAAVCQLIQRENARGIASERIALAGFSQGGAIALQTGLRYTERLAAIVALSTYVPLSDSLEGEASEANRDIPIFMAHGSQDPLIPMSFGRASKEKLEGLGYSVEWRDYPMPHSVCQEEIRDIGTWLRSVLR